MAEGILSGNWNAWADIVIKIWRQKMVRYAIGAYRKNRKISTQSLFDSFERHVKLSSGGDESRIDFIFKQYGLFVDLGVSKNNKYGNSRRVKKPWLNKTWYSEVMKVKEAVSKQLGEAAANRVIFGLHTTLQGEMGSGNVMNYSEIDISYGAISKMKKNNIII